MKREEMEQLNNLRKEIAELEKAINRIRQQCEETITDKVRASGSEFPYINGYKRVSGISMSSEERKKKMLRQKQQLLNDRKTKAEHEELKITEYINSVQDSRVRRIMQYRYIDGYTWDRIGEIMNYDKSYPQKLLSKYLDDK